VLLAENIIISSPVSRKSTWIRLPNLLQISQWLTIFKAHQIYSKQCQFKRQPTFEHNPVDPKIMHLTMSKDCRSFYLHEAAEYTALPKEFFETYKVKGAEFNLITKNYAVL